MLKFTAGFLCEITVIDETIPKCWIIRWLPLSFVGVFGVGPRGYFTKEHLYAKSPDIC